MGRMRSWLAVLTAAISLWAADLAARETEAANPATAATTPAGTSSETRPPKIPASAFASRNLFSTARLSPDGKTIAVRIVTDGKVQIALLNAGTRTIDYRLMIGETEELEWFRWAGNSRLLLSLSIKTILFDEEFRQTKLYSFDYPTKTFTYAGLRRQGLNGDDLLYTDPDGQFILLSLGLFPDVWKISLNQGEEALARKVQSAKYQIFKWYADDAGNVRMGLSFTGRKLKFWYRKNPDDDLKMVVSMSTKDADDKIWDVARIVSGSDEGYAIEQAGKTVALRKFNYATREAGEVVYQNPDWDVTGADFDQDGKPVATYFTDDKERVVWLDPKMGQLQARLEKALPDTDLWPVSRARDDSRMLIYAGREDDPGALYLYTAASRSLEFLGNYRPEIEHAQLARPRAIAFEARDKTPIRGYLTLPRGRVAKGLPLVILPHGGPFNTRDTLTYDDEVQFLANRGYAVLQPNFRGSGGFGEAFDKLGDGQIGRKMQDDLDDGMDWLVKQGIADPNRVCVVGASYGGYAALWAVIRNPERYRCAASFAGVTDWKKQLSYDGRFFDGKGRRKWRTHVVGEEKDFDMDSVSPARQVARLTKPVLLAHGDKDSNVPFSQFKRMRDAAEAAKVPVELLVFKDEGHGFDKPEAEQRWYEALEAFLTRHNPAD